MSDPTPISSAIVSRHRAEIQRLQDERDVLYDARTKLQERREQFFHQPENKPKGEVPEDGEVAAWLVLNINADVRGRWEQLERELAANQECIDLNVRGAMALEEAIAQAEAAPVATLPEPPSTSAEPPSMSAMLAELVTPPREHIAQFFTYEHLPPHLREASKPFADLAQIVLELPRNPERTVALRKLLEAKDAAVRALIAGGV